MTNYNEWENMEWNEELGEFVPKTTKVDSVNDEVLTKDSNGVVLQNDDAVMLIKDLDVKGSSLDLKIGTKIKKIKLIGDPENIECKLGKTTLVLKTCFLKKV